MFEGIDGKIGFITNEFGRLGRSTQGILVSLTLVAVAISAIAADFLHGLLALGHVGSADRPSRSSSN